MLKVFDLKMFLPLGGLSLTAGQRRKIRLLLETEIVCLRSRNRVRASCSCFALSPGSISLSELSSLLPLYR